VPGRLTADLLLARSAGVWLLRMGMLGTLSVVFGFAVARLLRRRGPAIMRK
jgi:hypothetical protein